MSMPRIPVRRQDYLSMKKPLTKPLAGVHAVEYNRLHGITPQTIRKEIQKGLSDQLAARSRVRGGGPR
jgi:excinuclease UvrABC helicase subunit UvrB